jgi:hypothetical protein
VYVSAAPLLTAENMPTKSELMVSQLSERNIEKRRLDGALVGAMGFQATNSDPTNGDSLSKSGNLRVSTMMMHAGQDLTPGLANS